MPARHIPVRPDLDQLKCQAKDLLRAIKRGDASSIEDSERIIPAPRIRSRQNSPMLNSPWREATVFEAGLGSLKPAKSWMQSGAMMPKNFEASSSNIRICFTRWHAAPSTATGDLR